MKKIGLIVFGLFAVVLLVGCQAQDPLDQMVNQTSLSVASTDAYDDVGTDDYVSSLSSTVISLSSSVELDVDQVQYARTLFNEIRLQHARNILAVDALKTSFTTLKADVEQFRSQELSLTDEDKVILIEMRDEIKDERDLILETKGEILQLFGELRGLYDVEHIDLIVSNFEMILDILNQRAAFITLVQGHINTAEIMVLSYITIE